MDLDVAPQEVVAQEYLKAPPVHAIVDMLNVQTLAVAIIREGVPVHFQAQAVEDKPATEGAHQTPLDVLQETVLVPPQLLVVVKPVLEEKQRFQCLLLLVLDLETVPQAHLLKLHTPAIAGEAHVTEQAIQRPFMHLDADYRQITEVINALVDKNTALLMEEILDVTHIVLVELSIK